MSDPALGTPRVSFSPTYPFGDASAETILRSSDGAEFYVHRAILSLVFPSSKRYSSYRSQNWLCRRLPDTKHFADARRLASGARQPHAPYSGDLFSDDYLSLTSNPELKSHLLETLSKQTNVLGSTGSRWIAGNSEWHVALEQRMMRLFSAPAALLYSSGFTENLGVLATPPQASDTIIFDQRIHTSCHAGMALSRTLPAACIQFAHNSIYSLRKCLVSVLASCPHMDGDVTPLEEIVSIINELVPSQSAHLMVDESHAMDSGTGPELQTDIFMFELFTYDLASHSLRYGQLF
ncbi:pyridoxal phosphate-dependent transferase [Mycena alexandri]|uniref:Pyridoxal phosphate-dependent transferase n=1 Tax=Mycena alexandri TaxID=1745969 RepID=A0AAD6S587_9AGAR|nr:pyridoxal phosphate-dependent transferase [Mycena alexandri]